MNLWKNHGTKILGTLITVLGIFTTVSQDTLTSLFGTHGPAVAVVIGGLLTFLRGFQNTTAAQDKAALLNPPPGVKL